MQVSRTQTASNVDVWRYITKISKTDDKEQTEPKKNRIYTL